jgi:putative NADPH-quinone reductase
MRALILLAHPEPRSFNAHLATQAAEQLRHDHLQVDVVDLYAEGFDPLEAAHHHSSRLQPDRFDAQREQRYGAEQGRLPADVQRHLQLLQAADLVILQFPLWWFAAPAILKGWLDRVLVYVPMYNSRRRHEHGAMRGKRALPSVTTGSSARACGMDGREGDTRLLLWPCMVSVPGWHRSACRRTTRHWPRQPSTTANDWRNGHSGPSCPSTTAWISRTAWCSARRRLRTAPSSAIATPDESAPAGATARLHTAPSSAAPW